MDDGFGDLIIQNARFVVVIHGAAMQALLDDVHYQTRYHVANPNLPVIAAYELTLRCSHLFNLLDARGALSVRERAAYIGRVRACARMCAQAWIKKREALGWPLLNRDAAIMPE